MPRPLLCTLLAFTAAPLFAGDAWPAWRGTHDDGVSDATGLATRWGDAGGDGKHVTFRTPLPGPGGSTPVVAEGNVFLTAVAGVGDEAKLVVLCVAAVGEADAGKIRWQRTVGRGNRNARSDEGNYASNSPVTDGGHVWVAFGSGDVACFTTDGEPVWDFNLQDRFGEIDIQFGYSSSPVLHGGRLFVQLIHGDGDARTEEARVVALDAATGETVWERKRVTGATQENEHSYASPLLYDFGGLAYLVTHGADHTIAYELEDGSERWRVGGLNPHGPNYHTTLRLVASPGISADTIVIPTAKRLPVYAVDPRATGTLTGTKAVRQLLDRGTPDVPSPLIHGGLIYLAGEDGVLTVLDESTGDLVYRERVHNYKHRASPVLADGHLYLTARDGTVSVVRAGREFGMVSQQSFGEPQSASPAVAGGTIYLRTFEALYAVGK